MDSQDNWHINTQLKEGKLGVIMIVNNVKQRHIQGNTNSAFLSEKVSKGLKDSEDKSAFLTLCWQIKLARRNTEVSK